IRTRHDRSHSIRYVAPKPPPACEARTMPSATMTCARVRKTRCCRPSPDQSCQRATIVRSIAHASLLEFRGPTPFRPVARGLGALRAEARVECGAEVGTHRELAMSAGERVLDQRLRAPRLSDRSLEFQKLGFHQSRP